MKSLFILFVLLISLCQTAFSLPEECNCEASSLRRALRARTGVPFQVSVRKVDGDHICHGVILDEETVISSASCVINNQVQVVAGISDLSNISPSNVHDVGSIHMPADYNIDVNENNVAILKLDSKLTLEDGKVEKACVRMIETDFKKATFSGFGAKGTYTIEMPDGEIQPQPKPSNKLKVINLQPIDGVATNGTVLYLAPKFGLGICLFDEGGSLFITKDNQVYTIAFTDQALMSNSQSNVNEAKLCEGRSAFVKATSVASFINKFASSRMCLINKE